MKTILLTHAVISILDRGRWREVEEIDKITDTEIMVVQVKDVAPEVLERAPRLRPPATHPRSPTKTQANPRKGTNPRKGRRW